MENELEIDVGNGIRLRRWRQADAKELALIANDRDIWINLRDAFPHPYTMDDAVAFIEMCRAETSLKAFAIQVNGVLAGGIGITMQQDVHRLTAEIGYWLGKTFWNKGIMTRAVAAFSTWAMANYDLERIYTGIYEWNTASMRVLEKCGYVKEGVARRAAIKDGKLIDLHQYGLTR